MEIKPYMGKEQKSYLGAVARLERVDAQVNAELPPAPKRGDLVALEAYANTRERLSTEHGLIDAVNEKLDARWALLDWAKGVLEQSMAGEPELLEVLAAFDSAPKYPAMLEELVQHCLTLNPSLPDTEMGER
jgi:hypothetical protein